VKERRFLGLEVTKYKGLKINEKVNKNKRKG
jgi:hypothetical protein